MAALCHGRTLLGLVLPGGAVEIVRVAYWSGLAVLNEAVLLR